MLNTKGGAALQSVASERFFITLVKDWNICDHAFYLSVTNKPIRDEHREVHIDLDAQRTGIV
jgi:hypothetical protein